MKEIIGNLSDLIGLLGAYLLARYFLARQPIDDAIGELVAGMQEQPDPKATQALNQSAISLQQLVTGTARQAYRKAAFGATLLLVAIALKLVSFVGSLREIVPLWLA